MLMRKISRSEIRIANPQVALSAQLPASATHYSTAKLLLDPREDYTFSSLLALKTNIPYALDQGSVEMGRNKSEL